MYSKLGTGHKMLNSRCAVRAEVKGPPYGLGVMVALLSPKQSVGVQVPEPVPILYAD